MTDHERDHIGFDPIAWIDRLIEVNRGSQFTHAQKSVILATLLQLRINMPTSESLS